jgi:hypothetical protein
MLDNARPMDVYVMTSNKLHNKPDKNKGSVSIKKPQPSPLNTIASV